MTVSGCQQCGENSYSGDGASSCISCPDGQVSDSGSKAIDDCQYGMFFCAKRTYFVITSFVIQIEN